MFQKNYKEKVSMKPTSLEDIEISLATIKTNIANTSYSYQADIQEQKILNGDIISGPPVIPPRNENRLKKLKKGKVKSQEEDLENKGEDYLGRIASEKRQRDLELIEEFHKKQQQDFNQKQI